MNKYYLICLILLCGCITLKKENMVVNGNVNDAISNAIFDFMHTEKKLLKADNTFFVSVDTNEECIAITIIGDPNSILLITEEDGTFNYNAFPTRLIETDGKLFFWYDETKNLSNSIIDILYKFDFVDTMIVNTYIPDRIVNDSKKGVIYYFCKSDLRNYKKNRE